MSAPGVRHFLHAIIGAVATPYSSIANGLQTIEDPGSLVAWAQGHFHKLIRRQDLLSKELIFNGSWLCAVLWNPFRHSRSDAQYIYRMHALRMDLRSPTYDTAAAKE